MELESIFYATLVYYFSTASVPYKYYMTVNTVDGMLYISDFMSHQIIRVKTMGPVRDLKHNYEVVAGNGEECTPGELDLCGDNGLAIDARLRHPKGELDVNLFYRFLFI